MKKLTYILSFVLLSAGFVACDKEPIDEEVKNDYKQGEQILRFDLNGVTHVAKGNEINTVVDLDGSMTISVNIKDERNDFNNISFTIGTSGKDLGTYNTAYVWGMMTEEYGYSQANLFYQGDLWNYNTHYLPDDHEFPDDVEEYFMELNRGSFTITEFNEQAGQIEGNFEFELVPPYDLDLDNDVPYPTPQMVTNGYFKYITIQ